MQVNRIEKRKCGIKPQEKKNLKIKIRNKTKICQKQNGKKKKKN